MANFLAVLAPAAEGVRAKTLFENAHRLARSTRSQVPAGEIHAPGCHVALYHRHRHTGPTVVSGPDGTFLLASGTWFHKGGLASGSERQLLELYTDSGVDAISRELEGFFVIVVGNSQKLELSVVTDVAGSCHAFVRDFGGVIAVSASSFVLGAVEESEFDPTACQEYLNTGIIYEDRTLYRQVRKVPPATIITYTQGRAGNSIRYWDIRNLHSEEIEPDSAPRLLAEKLAAAAKRIGSIFPNPVCDLTGGFDSRAVLAGFLMSGVHFATTVSGPATSADVVIARQLAEKVSVDHLHVDFAEALTFENLAEAFSYTDGEYDLADYARILRVHKKLSSSYDISINGSFGEVARGYWWELLWPNAGARVAVDAARISRTRYAAQPCDTSLYPTGARLDMISHFTDVFNRTNEGLATLPNTMQMDHAYLMMRMQRWQGRIGSSTDQLWPCLPLFLFRSVLETMLQTPPRMRRRSLLVRMMLAECRPDLANFPLEHGHPAAPVTPRNLHRFIPLARHYGDKVISRLKGKIGLRARVPQTTDMPLRLQLWQDPRVQQLLAEAGAKLGGILDPAGLTSFVDRSRGLSFSFSDQWQRLLSLCYVNERLAAARREIVNRW